jgi:hypothetical protein
MADVLRIKRRAAGGAAGPPATLAAAEIAFNEQDNTLYYGKGNSGGMATSIIAIAGANPGGSSGDVGRNLLHNSLFNVLQRGGGPFTSGHAADRWFPQLNVSTISITFPSLSDVDRSQIGDEAARYCYTSAATGTAGAADFVIAATQRIEDVRRLAGKTVTLSFWAKAGTGTPKVGIELDQMFGSGGSPSANVTGIGSQSFTLSTTWQRFTASIAMPSVAGKTLGSTAGSDYTELRIWQSSGATNNALSGGVGVQSYTLQLWGIQLEIGSVATPLEKPDPQQDLAKCQRFYALGNVNFAMQGVAGQNFANTITLPVWMRANPTITFGSPALTNCTGLAIVQPNAGQMTVYALTTATGQTQINSNYTASADL